MNAPIDVTIRVRADQPTGPYRPIWNWFGHDEPNYTYTANGRKLLRELAALSPEPVRLRTHNLLTSGDGVAALKWGSTNAYTEDAAGRPVYDWTILDRIFDTYAEIGVMPFVQIGFTPQALSDHPGPYRHDWTLASPYTSITTGWAAPPRDLARWSDLIEAWATHLASRYGHATVSSWPWEVWNEPDGHYWTGTVEQFCALYDASARALRRVLPAARIGGPHTCGPSASERAAAFLRGFLRHVVEHGSPLDFVAFHAKGAPELHDGHVRMGLTKQLRDIEAGLAIVAEFPTLRGLPVILGESDPEGCAACSARVYPRNGYRNGPLYGAYVVEAVMRTYELARRAGVTIEGAVNWAFLFEDQPFFDGFRDLATNGIDKAVLNALRMLGRLGGDWLTCESSHALGLETVLADGVRGAPDVNAVATRDAGGISVLIWHYHDDDVAVPDAAITLTVEAAAAGSVRHERMDAGHSNAFAAWRAMGSPQAPTPAQYAALEAAGQLCRLDAAVTVTRDAPLTLRLTLPRQGVSLLRLEPAAGAG
jgi:xylan 1,4-beta-xylosidase